MTRATTTARDLSAGCFVCWGDQARWRTANAQALAARHHDQTGHRTWCDIYLVVRYGTGFPDPRQTDLEDSIAAAAAAEPDTGRRPEVAAARPVPEAPTSGFVGVSAPEGRPSRRAAVKRRGARGHKPETEHV